MSYLPGVPHVRPVRETDHAVPVDPVLPPGRRIGPEHDARHPAPYMQQAQAANAGANPGAGAAPGADDARTAGASADDVVDADFSKKN